MKYHEVLNFILKLLKARPKYIIGGSVGLILQGAIPEREVTDFDLCVNVPGILGMDQEEVKKLLVLCDLDFDIDYPIDIVGDYKCLKIQSDKRACKQFGESFYYNIFLREQTRTIPITIGDQVINVQHQDEIFKYKYEWQRSKDIADIDARF